MTDIGAWAIVLLYLVGLFALCARAVNWLTERGWLSDDPLPWEGEPRSHVTVVRDERGGA